MAIYTHNSQMSPREMMKLIADLKSKIAQLRPLNINEKSSVETIQETVKTLVSLQTEYDLLKAQFDEYKLESEAEIKRLKEKFEVDLGRANS